MENKDDDFVEKFLAPWNRPDVDGALSMMTEDCVWEITRGPEPHGTLFKGRSEVRGAIADAFVMMPDVHYQPLRCHYGQDHVGGRVAGDREAVGWLRTAISRL